MGIVSNCCVVYFGSARHSRFNKDIVDNSGGWRVKMDLTYSKHFQSKRKIKRDPSF
jgi:hypothetical protein